MNEPEVHCRKRKRQAEAEFVVATTDSTKTREEKIDILDRISALPEDIIHHILSCIAHFGSVNLIRISLLSKYCNNLCASCPILGFAQPSLLDSLFHNYTPKERNDFFINFVDRSMRRFNDLKRRDMHRFWLSITKLDTKLGFHINNWVSLALQNHIKQLLLKISSSCSNRKYHVLSTENLFASKSLNVLELIGCKLELPRFNHSTLCPLQTLHLRDVYLDEDTMENIRRSCPLITIFKCKGTKVLGSTGLHNLEEVSVTSYERGINLAKVYIKALSLRCLTFESIILAHSLLIDVNI